jgi:hypothetical protein
MVSDSELAQPAFNRNRLKAEKLIDSKVLEQLIRVQGDAGCSRAAQGFHVVFSERAKTVTTLTIFVDGSCPDAGLFQFAKFPNQPGAMSDMQSLKNFKLRKEILGWLCEDVPSKPFYKVALLLNIHFGYSDVLFSEP